MRKHDRKKRSSPIVWSFVITILVIAAVSAVWVLSQPEAAPPTEPEPVGTPRQSPTVDQRPVPAASSVPPAASASSAPAQPQSGSASASLPAEASSAAVPVPEEPVQGIDAKDGEQMVRGVIVDATTSSMTIRLADGTQLSFMRETADVTGRLVEEAEAEVYYVGTISGTDTSAAFVTKIIAFA